MEKLPSSSPGLPSPPWAERRLSQIACEAGTKKLSPTATGARTSRVDSADSFSVALDYADSALYSQASPEDRFTHQEDTTRRRRGSSKAPSPAMANGVEPIKRLKHPADQSLLLPLVGTLVFVLLALITCVPAVAVACVVVPAAYAVRRLVSCRRCTRVGCPDLLSATDRYWLHETEVSQAVNQCLLHLDGSLDATRLRDLLLARLVSAESKRGSKLYARFTQRVLPAACGYQWSNDDEFNIDNHVTKVGDSFRTKADVVGYLSRLSCQGLRRDRPLWEVYMLELGAEQPDTLLAFRVHACVSDGINLTELLHKALADPHSKTSVSVPRKNRFGRRALLFNSIRALVVGPLVALRQLLCGNGRAGPIGDRRPTGQKAVAWSDAIHVPPVYRVKLVARCTMNDVALSAVAGSLRAYFQSQGDDHPADSGASVAVDLRGSKASRAAGVGPMGNRFALARLRLPTGTEGAIPRLWDTKRRMDELKLSSEHVVLYGLTRAVVTVFPEAAAQSIMGSFFDGSGCTVSNMPLGEEILSVGGRQLKMVLFWMAPRDEVPLSVSLLTYAGQMRIAILADKGVVPNPQPIADEYKRQIETLVSLLAHRRIPGEYRRRTVDEDEDEDEEIDPLEEEIRTPSSASGRKPRPLSANCLQRPGSRSSSVMRPLSTSSDGLEAANNGGVVALESGGAEDGPEPRHHQAVEAAGPGPPSRAGPKRPGSGGSCSVECVSFTPAAANSDGDSASVDISPSVERRSSIGQLV